MTPNWKPWVATAAALLLVGAGCAGSTDPYASTDVNGKAVGEVKVEADAPVGIDADVDAMVNAALGEVDASTQTELQENADVNVVTNDDSELKAYGQAYVQNDL